MSAIGHIADKESHLGLKLILKSATDPKRTSGFTILNTNMAQMQMYEGPNLTTGTGIATWVAITAMLIGIGSAVTSIWQKRRDGIWILLGSFATAQIAIIVEQYLDENRVEISTVLGCTLFFLGIVWFFGMKYVTNSSISQLMTYREYLDFITRNHRKDVFARLVALVGPILTLVLCGLLVLNILGYWPAKG
jgi:hypothetical protein